MPLGSYKNNFTAIVAGAFIIVSLFVTAGQVMWNTRNIKTTVEHLERVIDNQEDLIRERKEMLQILRGLERRYLAIEPDKH